NSRKKRPRRAPSRCIFPATARSGSKSSVWKRRLPTSARNGPRRNARTTTTNEIRMPVRLNTAHPDFAASFKALLDTKRESSADVEASVRAIVNEVAKGGDEALVALSKKFDRVDLAKTGLKVSPE